MAIRITKNGKALPSPTDAKDIPLKIWDAIGKPQAALAKGGDQK